MEIKFPIRQELGFGRNVAAESKLIEKVTNIQKNIRDATRQIGNGGLSVIDGTKVGATLEDFLTAFGAFTRTSVPKRISNGARGAFGQVLFVHRSGYSVFGF